MSTAASMDATTPPPEAGSSLSPPPPGGESSKLGPPPSSSVGENSPPSPPPSPSPPPPSPQSPPPPAPSPPPHSKSPPHSEPPKSSPSPSPPPPIPSPPHSSPVSPPPAVFIPPPTSGHASPPPPPTLTTPPPTAVSLSPPAVILSPSPPAAESLPPPTAPATNVPPISPGLIPPPPADLPLTPPVSTSPPVHGGSPAGHSTSTSSNAKSSNLSGTPTANGNDAGGTTSTKVVAGGVVAAAVLLGLIAIFFVVRIKRKRQKPYASHNMVPPTSYTVNTAGYYSGQANHSYGSHPPHFGARGDSLGSQRGNLYVGGDPESGVIGGSKSIYAYDEVMEMTSGFARQNIIGEGGFGCVYKGRMLDGREVAVKQLKAGSGQGDREFKAEVEIISRVHHRHLVSLVGYSMSDHQLMLIYEFVPNKTLEHHLHEKGLQALDWPKRLKIAIGSAKGLAYLHEDCHPKIIHRDIKSANILLDNDFEAQVADFGLARLNDTTQTHVSTRVMGTFGYLAPEYASSGKLTDRSDVFSFGVVLLELITGRKPVDPTQPLGDESLVEWARPLLVRAVETGDISELVDPRLEKNYVESEMLRMVDTAAGCVRHSAPKRPRMVQVVRALDSENEMSDLSNGVKYGQSTVYDSGQYNQEIMNFRRMALGSKEGAEFNTYSGEYSSRDASQGLSSSGYTSGESETRAMNRARR